MNVVVTAHPVPQPPGLKTVWPHSLIFPAMPHGFNRTVEHAGRKLHVQIEDLSPRQPVFDVRVYEGGQVLFHKKVNHTEALAGEDGAGRTERLRAAAEKLLVTMTEAIQRGKIKVGD